MPKIKFYWQISEAYESKIITEFSMEETKEAKKKFAELQDEDPDGDYYLEKVLI
jgi:hypothetical protein